MRRPAGPAPSCSFGPAHTHQGSPGSRGPLGVPSSCPGRSPQTLRAGQAVRTHRRDTFSVPPTLFPSAPPDPVEVPLGGPLHRISLNQPIPSFSCPAPSSGLTFIDAQSAITATQLSRVAKADLVTVSGWGWVSPGQVTLRATETSIASLHTCQLGHRLGVHRGTGQGKVVGGCGRERVLPCKRPSQVPSLVPGTLLGVIPEQRAQCGPKADKQIEMGLS